MVELVEGEGGGVTETKPEGGEFCAVVPLAPGSGWGYVAAAVPRLKDLDASVSVEGKLEKLAAVESRQLAAAHGAISMFLKNLRESPEQLLAAYEQSFDVPADRRAIESEIPMESAVG